MTYPVHMTVTPHVSAFFDEVTNTISYIVSELMATTVLLSIACWTSTMRLVASPMTVQTR